MLGRIYCVFRGHDWSDWEVVHGETCKQQRQCLRGAHTQVRENHEWQTESHPCVKECISCGKTKNVHQWNGWTQIHDGITERNEDFLDPDPAIERTARRANYFDVFERTCDVCGHSESRSEKV